MGYRITALATLILLAPLVAQAAESAKLDTVTIVTSGGSHSFTVEVMRSEAERERGLMYRKQLAADHGMLFDFGTAAPVMMWMKNTYIPLDMIFIASNGTVLSTQQNAQPLSERVIPSGGAALGVLEVNAGTVALDGIKPGDAVRNALFPH